VGQAITEETEEIQVVETAGKSQFPVLWENPEE